MGHPQWRRAAPRPYARHPDADQRRHRAAAGGRQRRTRLTRLTPRTLTLDGNRIHDIASFYDEINRVFMADESWRLGASLDALDDMLRGGYGAAGGKEPVVLVWLNMTQSRAALGAAAAQAYYQAKLARPDIFNADRARAQLAALANGTGQTYFDIVMEIIASHPRIMLQAM
jgi:RNAse (barnase) inhibitor barstar